MKHYEFIAKVEATKKADQNEAREWLKNATRFQLKKNGVGQNSIPVRLISERYSVIDSGNCLGNISEGIKLILDCLPTFEKLISKSSNNQQDIIDMLKKVYNETKGDLQKRIKPEEIESTVSRVFELDYPTFFKANQNEEFGEWVKSILSHLEKMKANYENRGEINPLVYKIYGEDFKNILQNVYHVERQDLPSAEEPFEPTLGFYLHKGEILIYLDAIYDFAISLGLNPYLLYRKVLIHELAHAFHHRGFDAKDKIWGGFSYSEPTRVKIVEGLAQWHAMQYMQFLDNKERNVRFDNLITIFWASLFQPSQYRHYLGWANYTNENIRQTIVQARSMTGALKKSIDFDKELSDNHAKQV